MSDRLIAMRRIIRNVGLAWMLALVAFVVIASKLFHPYHRLVAVIVYFISWIPFVLSFRDKRHWLREQRGKARGFLLSNLPHTALGILLLLFLYVAWVLVPVKSSPLSNLAEKDLAAQLEQDLTNLRYLNEATEGILTDLRQSNLNWQDEWLEWSRQQQQDLLDQWSKFVEKMVEFDLLREFYRGFYKIDVLTKPIPHSDSFLAAYSALLAQYRHTLMLTNLIEENPSLPSPLNQGDNDRGIPRNTYKTLKLNLTHPDEILRLNAGRAYLKLVRRNVYARHALLQAVEGYLRDIEHSLAAYPKLLVENPFERFEAFADRAWFPLVKSIGLSLSYIRGTSRDYFISPKLVQKYQSKLEPGDVLLERRNWHATNMGIPGFWPHAALYTGTLEIMDAFFDGAPTLQGTTMSAFLEKELPDAYSRYQEVDDDGYPFSVIEAKRPGVILTSTEFSMNADSVAAMRPRISKEEKLQALLTAFRQLGKPYDFNFDFRTRNALVCSELVYRALNQRGPIRITPPEINGRPLFSPNNFARKFAEEFGTPNQQFNFVFFLGASEKRNTVSERSREEFRESWQWPKWEILQE